MTLTFKFVYQRYWITWKCENHISCFSVTLNLNFTKPSMYCNFEKIHTVYHDSLKENGWSWTFNVQYPAWCNRVDLQPYLADSDSRINASPKCSRCQGSGIIEMEILSELSVRLVMVGALATVINVVSEFKKVLDKEWECVLKRKKQGRCWKLTLSDWNSIDYTEDHTQTLTQFSKISFLTQYIPPFHQDPAYPFVPSPLFLSASPQ